MEFYAISHFQPEDARFSLFVITMLTLAALSCFGALFAIATDKSPSRNDAPPLFSFLMICAVTFLVIGFFQFLRIEKEQRKHVSQTYSQYLQTVDRKTLISSEKLTALDDTKSHYYIKRELQRREAQEVAGDLKIIK
jgi:hypothetical protein